MSKTRTLITVALSEVMLDALRCAAEAGSTADVYLLLSPVFEELGIKAKQIEQESALGRAFIEVVKAEQMRFLERVAECREKWRGRKGKSRESHGEVTGKSRERGVAPLSLTDSLSESSIEDCSSVVTSHPPPRKAKRTNLVPPSVEEVDKYCREAELDVDAERFVDYYAAQGWKLSNGNVLKDWRAAARNWSKRGRGGHNTAVPLTQNIGGVNDANRFDKLF